MKEGKLIWPCIAIIALAGLLTQVPSKKSPQISDDVDRLCDAPTLVANAIQDWYWWHRQFPTDDRVLQPYIRSAPAEWQPKASWIVKFDLAEGTEPDLIYGGKLAHMKITFIEKGTVIGSKICPVDLRNPDRLWKPHRTELGPSVGNGGIADTDKNISDTIAYEALAFMNDKGMSSVNPREFAKYGNGIELSERGLLKRYLLNVTGGQIEVTNVKSKTVRHYPMGGPAVVNAHVPNWAH